MLRSKFFPTTVTGGSADQASAYYRRGTELGRQKQFAKAQAAFEKAIEISPDDATSHRSLGTSLADQEKFDEADAAFHKAASLPNGKSVWRRKPLGFCSAIFPDDNAVEEYWSNLNERLDEAIAEDIPIDWQTCRAMVAFPRSICRIMASVAGKCVKNFVNFLPKPFHRNLLKAENQNDFESAFMS